MRWIDRFSRRFSRFAIPNLMVYISGAMALVYVLHFIMRSPIIGLLQFDRSLILHGEVWRLLSFLLVPIDSRLLFFVISIIVYLNIGRVLESVWGSTRFTLYYLLGIVGCIISGFIAGSTTNTFLNLSLFFAYASLFPDAQFLLMFIIPVKAKYLAWVNWALFLISFLFGSLAVKLSIVFSLINYFIFFGPDNIQRFKDWRRVSKRRREFQRDMRNNRDRWS